MSVRISDMMGAVRLKRPLVHHITNYVTVNDCANICICAGGSPVMTDEAKDIPEMVALASAVVLNIGTLNERTISSMILAGKCANEKNIPVILDPVGVGATTYRTETAWKILNKVKVSVIKGNSGEIAVLAGAGGEVKGVDSVSGSEGTGAVLALSKKTGAIVASTGKIDYISDGKKVYVLRNGDDYLGTVSGTGCMVSSVIGCYVGACGVTAEAVACGISAFNIAAEIAAEKAFGPGSFKTKLFDSIYGLDEKEAATRLNYEEE